MKRHGRTGSVRMREWLDSSGKRHRVGGPAVEWEDGSKAWWLRGERHRVDGPAIEHSDGVKSWYCMGKFQARTSPWGHLVMDSPGWR